MTDRRKHFLIGDFRFANARHRGRMGYSKFDIRKSTLAFTLVELMVVVIVIGVLAALIVPNFFGRIGQSRQAVARQKIASLGTAITLFMQDHGRVPNSLEELVVKPDDVPEDQWVPTGIQQRDLVDPWGNPFVYQAPS